MSESKHPRVSHPLAPELLLYRPVPQAHMLLHKQDSTQIFHQTNLLFPDFPPSCVSLQREERLRFQSCATRVLHILLTGLLIACVQSGGSECKGQLDPRQAVSEQPARKSGATRALPFVQNFVLSSLVQKGNLGLVLDSLSAFEF